MKKEYTLTVNKRLSRPRSERLRSVGGMTASGGGSTVVSVTSSADSVRPEWHTHGNKSTLDRISADEESYLYLEQLREKPDGTGYIACTEKVRSGYADDAGHAYEADYAEEAGNADKWDYQEFGDYLDQPVRKNDAVAFDSVTTDSVVGSGSFVDGLLGSNFRIWKDKNGVAYLTVDKLTVRQTMRVMEVLINKVRSVGGQICVSAANGKIKSVEESDNRYLITFEQENMFVQHDLVRCQTFTGKDMRSYWVEVADVTTSGIVVAKDEFDGVLPKNGDECVLMGNTRVESRQNLVLISATEDGQPRVDVMDGVRGKSLANCLRARLGNLDGIKDDKFPANRQPSGNGLYADNAYLKGTFVLDTGEDVRTRFEITEGKVQSAIDGVRNEFLSDKGYLNDPAFMSGLEKWDTENDTVFFLVGNRWTWANENVLSKKGDGTSVVTDMGRKVVRICNKYIRQKHENLRYVPSMPSGKDGKKEAMPVYLSFFYRCAKAGTLKVGFENVDKTGFANFNSMDVREALGVTNGYVQYTCSGLWNGTGDFKLSFDGGDIYLYMLVLSTDKVDVLTYKYKTLFEQSERLVKISAAVYDKDEKMLEETGLITTSKVSGLYAIDENGMLRSFVGAGQDGVKIKAENIQLEGLVTANENFKILEDGSIEAQNATIYGKVYVDDGGKVGGFNILRSCMIWGGGGAEIRLGYDLRHTNNTCVYIKAENFSHAIAGIAPLGGSGIYGSCRSAPTFPDSNTKCAGYFDGDLLVKSGNIIVTSGSIQADSVLPRDGWSGKFKDKTVTVKNGIITNVS